MVAPVSTELQWDSLPSDLKELVLAHLSRAELLRVRSVSREWLTILTSSHFHRLHRGLHPRANPSLLVYNHAIKISACDWHNSNVSESVAADVDSLSDAAPSASWRDLTLPTAFVREWVGTSGLICVRNHLTANAFSVGCPFSNQWKALPNPPRAPLLSKLWAMVPHTSTKAKNTFSVLLLQLNSPSVYLDVYDSESNEWKKKAVPSMKGSGKGTSISFSSAAACVGGLVYSVQAESRSIITYDVQRDVWKTLDAKLPANLVFQVPKPGGSVQTVPHMIEGCRGKVLMVGAASYAWSDISGDTGAGNNGEVISYAVVWELDWSRKEWTEMARAPSDMCADMVEEAMESCKAALTPVKYSGHAELVVAMASGAQRALQFDLIEEKWAWLDLPSAVNCDLTLCLQPNSVEHFFK